VNVHVPIESVACLLAVDQARGRQARRGRIEAGGAGDVGIRELATADGNAAGESSVVAVDPGVTDSRL